MVVYADGFFLPVFGKIVLEEGRILDVVVFHHEARVIEKQDPDE